MYRNLYRNCLVTYSSRATTRERNAGTQPAPYAYNGLAFGYETDYRDRVAVVIGRGRRPRSATPRTALLPKIVYRVTRGPADASTRTPRASAVAAQQSRSREGRATRRSGCDCVRPAVRVPSGRAGELVGERSALRGYGLPRALAGPARSRSALRYEKCLRRAGASVDCGSLRSS